MCPLECLCEPVGSYTSPVGPTKGRFTLEMAKKLLFDCRTARYPRGLD